jgi:DNA/RNA endonuclease YhcR with UshA esterase domain
MNEQAIATQEAQPRQRADRVHCPSCGRFVGPYERCPHCGARQTGRLAVRTLKGMAVAVALIGILILGWAARRAEIPLITAAEAGGTMNFATVRIRGEVAPGLTYDPESDYLGFWVEDETGEVRVNAYRDVTRDLLRAGTLPLPGDAITLAGTLRVREDFTALTLNAADHLTLVRPPAETAAARDVTPLDAGRRFALTGEVQEVVEPYEGLTLITLADESGALPVAVDTTLAPLTGAFPEVAAGQRLAVTGTVRLYRGAPQLAPADPSDVRPLSGPPPTPTPLAPRPLAAVAALPPGTIACARGRIAALVGLKGGVKATLDDGTARLPVVLWSRIYDALPDPAGVDVGAEVEITAEVAHYQGAPELMPDSAADVRVLVPAEPPPWLSVGDLSVHDAGRVVRVRGVVDQVWGFSKGVKLELNDGTGVVDVVLWADLYDRIAPKPETGLPVEIAGVVEVYRDAPELIPRSIHDWRVHR